jgi:hypothetical protein
MNKRNENGIELTQEEINALFRKKYPLWSTLIAIFAKLFVLGIGLFVGFVIFTIFFAIATWAVRFWL